jgi:hypothetical protein
VAMVKAEFFKCPKCAALYQVIKVEAGPETANSEVPQWNRVRAFAGTKLVCSRWR